MQFKGVIVLIIVLFGCVNVFGQKMKDRIEIGSYLATVSETSIDQNTGYVFGPVQVNMRIKIISVDEAGKVKAEVTIASRKGYLSGTLNSDDKLQLEGGLVAPNKTVYEIKLSATVDGKTMRTGKYVSQSGVNKITGEFNLAVFEEE